jgi:hypothetical protein
MSQNINEEKAMTLAECILTNDKWKRVWQREYITELVSSIFNCQRYGEVYFPFPSQATLEQLDKKYRKLFWQQLYKLKQKSMQGRNNL